MRTALLACGVVICCCAVLAWQPAKASANGVGSLDRAERKVIRIVNRIRARHGLRRLKASRPLARAATVHTGDMLARDFLSHSSSDGTAMPDRVRRFTGRKAWVGESIAGDPGPRHRAQGGADVDELAAAPRGPARARGAPDRGRQAPRQARERASRRLHGRSHLARLSSGSGAVPDSIAPR